MLARVRLESICQRRVVVYVSLLLGMLAVPVLAAEGDGANTATSDGNAVPQPAIRVEEIVIRAPRVRIVSPLPGVGIDLEQAATNIQSATAKEISESRAINITEFMNNNMQSVSINDYAGNPFQQDLNFRGFTASPMIGTPQGISVYLDGVRVNEAFGDVVNWDLLPMNAIASMDLLPGSSPLFGLNTLGGALAIRTKSGFTDHHARGEVIGGAWGRQQVQVSNGINNGVLGLFTAYNHFEEDGWRQKSPSNLRQLYNNLTLKLPKGEINFSALNVDTALTGNGLVPFEMAETNRKWVFSSPDESGNKLDHYNLNGRWDVNDYISVSAMAYKRKMHQTALSGDAYDEVNRLPAISAERLTGLFNLSDLNQSAKGWTLQAMFDLDRHQVTAGASYDTNDIRFLQSQQLAEMTPDREIFYVDPALYNEAWMLEAAMRPIIRNNLTGSSRTKGVFFSDTWSPMDNLHITYGARFNWANVKNTLRSDRGLSLYNFGYQQFDPSRDYCKGSRPLAPGQQDLGRWVCTDGNYSYRSLNPSIGVVWQALDSLSLYGNISRGARIPTVIELGCARDYTADNSLGSTNYQYGCSIPTSLSADPYLKQVRSTAYEIGMRGVSEGFSWNVGVFRTELKDDILFMPLGRKNRGVFDNFGATLRQGVEMGFRGAVGRSRFGLNYTYLLATFESSATAINPNNSAHVVEPPPSLQTLVNISPGDSLPGMPRHIVQANWNYRFSDRFDMTLNMIMHSSSYVRGNENNEHRPREAGNYLVGSNRVDIYDYLGEGSIPGYATFNLRASYRFDAGFTLFIKADNIFDKQYATAGDLGRTPFDAGGNYQRKPDGEVLYHNTTFIGPGAPRAVWIGLAYDLDWKKVRGDSKQ
ncbi:TonB-dependent receptor [Methylobacillus sp.]|uniref:TonB-dependent receptor n=1 Tax=Methylobacillus sp. TaxID=56818 RepID=UPI00257FE289|nr:TonB-dependent receptor [Methylobacillus sp.]